MKKILFITALLIGFLGSAQDSIVKAVSLKGRGPFLVKGSITGTTITGAQIVDSLNLELGSTDWQDGATTDASELASGVLDDGRVQESNVTQHEGALSITESQISDLESYLETSALIDDDTFATATNTNIPSAESVKAYVDANAGGTAGLDQESASTKTLGIDDAWKIFKNTGTSDFIYTIPTQANESFTEDIAYTFWVGDTGKLFVKGQTGAGVPAREISTVEKYATITRFGENNWTWGGTTSAWNWNLYQVANSISENEANAVTGVTGTANWTPTSVSSGPAPKEGTYSMVFTHSGATNTSHTATIDLTGMEIGATYRIGLWMYKMFSDTALGGGSAYVFTNHWESLITIGQVVGATPLGEWVYHEIEAVPTTTTPTIRVDAASTSDPGFSYAIDGLTIEKIAEP